jgi:hypothetical protein
VSGPDAHAYARLAHDVGKYVARIAHNIGDGPIPSALAGLLARDLYELPGDRRASVVFEERRADLPDAPELSEATAHLEAIDALEKRVRAGEEEAMREAAKHALAVERSLRGIAERMRREEG